MCSQYNLFAIATSLDIDPYVPGRCDCNNKLAIFNLVSKIDILIISHEISQNLTDE